MKSKIFPSLKTGLIVLSFICLVFVPSCGSTPSQVDEAAVPQDAAPSGKIILADISDDPASKIKSFQPMADYLAENLSDFGIGTGEVKIATSLEEMTAWMAAGEVDIYFDSLYPAMIVSEGGEGQIVLRRWKGGDAEYHSVIFASAASGLESIADLNGSLIAFEEPFSTSGFMLPMGFLAESGLFLVEKDSIAASVRADEVGYTFSNDDLNTLQWVVSGKVVAGATDSQNFEELLASSDEELTILAETISIPRQVMVVRSGMDPALLGAITNLLTNMHEDPEAQDILETFKTAKFDLFPAEELSSLAWMRQVYEIVQNQNIQTE